MRRTKKRRINFQAILFWGYVLFCLTILAHESHIFPLISIIFAEIAESIDISHIVNIPILGFVFNNMVETFSIIVTEILSFGMKVHSYFVTIFQNIYSHPEVTIAISLFINFVHSISIVGLLSAAIGSSILLEFVKKSMNDHSAKIYNIDPKPFAKHYMHVHRFYAIVLLIILSWIFNSPTTIFLIVLGMIFYGYHIFFVQDHVQIIKYAIRKGYFRYIRKQYKVKRRVRTIRKCKRLFKRYIICTLRKIRMPKKISDSLTILIQLCEQLNTYIDRVIKYLRKWFFKWRKVTEREYCEDLMSGLILYAVYDKNVKDTSEKFETIKFNQDILVDFYEDYLNRDTLPIFIFELKSSISAFFYDVKMDRGNPDVFSQYVDDINKLIIDTKSDDLYLEFNACIKVTLLLILFNFKNKNWPYEDMLKQILSLNATTQIEHYHDIVILSLYMIRFWIVSQNGEMGLMENFIKDYDVHNVKPIQSFTQESLDITYRICKNNLHYIMEYSEKALAEFQNDFILFLNYVDNDFENAYLRFEEENR